MGKAADCGIAPRSRTAPRSARDASTTQGKRPGRGTGRRPLTGYPLPTRLTALAEQLMTDAVNARFRKDPDTFERCAAQLANRLGTPGWQRIVDRVLFASLLPGVTAAWRQGWQPAELVRQVSRMADEWHALMATELIGAELHRYARRDH